MSKDRENKSLALYTVICGLGLAAILYLWNHIWGAVSAILVFVRDFFLGL